MMEKPYINRLSGNILPTYNSVQKLFRSANGKDFSIDYLKACLLQGLQEEDVNSIIRFYEDLNGKTDSRTLKILCNKGETPKVQFGELSSENVSFDADMQYLKDPSLIVSEIVIGTTINKNCYGDRNPREHIEELQKNLNGAGIESTIKFQDRSRIGGECTLTLGVPMYKDDGFENKVKNRYQKLTKPNYARLDELVNALELVQGAFKEIVKVQQEDVAKMRMRSQISAAAICDRQLTLNTLANFL